ncbi:MAG: ROK family protein [Clostridia bacterium]|nr:ROK family protein [Clostridia bacterium]
MIGFDIGGTKCAVTVGEEIDGILHIKNKMVIPTDHTISAYEMIDRMCCLATEMTDDFSHIGISCGGPLNNKTGVIISPPNLPTFRNIEIVEYLKKKYGGFVRLENDADACAFAEWKYGAGRGCQNMIFLTFGTGLGAGLILNGKLYTGANGNAGEVGHIRLRDTGPIGFGKSGSFEGFASGGGIAQMGKTAAKEQLSKGIVPSYCKTLHELDSVTAQTVAKAAYNGDPTAIGVYKKCGEMLGLGLSILIDILNPERIVIGSIYTRSSDLLKESMLEVLNQEALKPSLEAVEILPATLGENLGDYAALSLAADNH